MCPLSDVYIVVFAVAHIDLANGLTRKLLSMINLLEQIPGNNLQIKQCEHFQMPQHKSFFGVSARLSNHTYVFIWPALT